MTVNKTSLQKIVVWRGKSLIDGSPIQALLTIKHSNRKIGSRTVQLWILPMFYPFTQNKANRQSHNGVCGACPMGGQYTGQDTKRTCYVNAMSVNTVWKGVNELSVNMKLALDVLDLLHAPVLRLGAWGDPAAVPKRIINKLAKACVASIGYTHQWKQLDQLKGLVMASTSSDVEAREAQAQGWKTYRIGTARAGKGEIECPSKLKSCDQCQLCDGSTVNVFIEPHGVGTKEIKAKMLVESFKV